MKTVFLAAAVLASLSAAAVAQRDPAYAAARAAGEVGEPPDGYRGVVGAINIQRKARYTQAAENGATVEQMAFPADCTLIARTEPGEKYRTPDGAWKTRTAAPPERDPRCI